VLWTREGALIDANDAFLSMVGYTREELEAGAMRWVNMTPAEYAPLDQQAYAEMDERGFCTPYEKEYVAKDGQRIPIQLGVAFWEGRRDGGVAWILDIRQRKQAELAREAALAGERAYRRNAEDASRAKDEFLSTLSHECARR
jgi:PAS domain S-box-containing protein